MEGGAGGVGPGGACLVPVRTGVRGGLFFVLVFLGPLEGEGVDPGEVFLVECEGLPGGMRRSSWWNAKVFLFVLLMFGFICQW